MVLTSKYMLLSKWSVFDMLPAATSPRRSSSCCHPQDFNFARGENLSNDGHASNMSNASNMGNDGNISNDSNMSNDSNEA